MVILYVTLFRKVLSTRLTLRKDKKVPIDVSYVTGGTPVKFPSIFWRKDPRTSSWVHRSCLRKVTSHPGEGVGRGRAFEVFDSNTSLKGETVYSQERRAGFNFTRPSHVWWTDIRLQAYVFFCRSRWFLITHNLWTRSYSHCDFKLRKERVKIGYHTDLFRYVHVITVTCNFLTDARVEVPSE